jgi:acyl dehydratase
MMNPFFEDMEVGSTERFGDYVVDREEVLDFARKFDPQPFHLSDEGAAKTHFGQLTASGWHTASMMMAMVVANMQAHPGRQEASVGGAGIENLRWLKPVVPGDRLRCEAEIVEKIPLRSRTDIGMVKVRTAVFNQNDEKVLEMVSTLLILTHEGAREAGLTSV